jgi:phenylacetyl-CoA:acceptor oxidoreductase 26-kDa subunit
MTKPQHHWDLRAALNFMLGGAGAGLIVVSAFLPQGRILPIAAGATLVAAGLISVWLEIGKKLRALHVFFNPITSWMTRESFAALLLFPLALGAILTGKYLWAPAIAAAAFLYCQARILRAARGIPAWRAPAVVPLIVTTGLAEGAALALFFVQEALVLSFFAALVLARALAWARYRTEVKGEALELPGRQLLQIGTVAAAALIVAALLVEAAAWLAAAAVLATGWRLKYVLVTRAGFQGFSLPRAPVRGLRSGESP